MGFQPMRQSLILGYLTVIFEYPLDEVKSIIFPVKEKKEERRTFILMFIILWISLPDKM